MGRRLAILIAVPVLLVGLAYPAEAHARGFFRGLFKGVRKVVTFVVDTPAKIAKGVTRPLGPVLGPIASEILLAQLPSNVARIVDKAERVRTVVKDVEDQQARIDAGKKAIREQKARLAATRERLDAVKEGASQRLASGEISYAQYKEKLADIGRLKAALDEVGAKLGAAEKNLRPENLGRLIARDALKRVGGGAKDVLFRELDAEISKFVNPEFIDRIVNKRPLRADEVIGLVLEGDIKRVIKDKSKAGDKEFVARVRDGLKDALKEEKDLLKGDWRERVAAKIDEIVEEGERQRRGADEGVDDADGGDAAAGEDEKDGSELERAAGYYAVLLCIVTDPSFWESMGEGIAEGLFGGTDPKEQAAEEDKWKSMNEGLLRKYGFLTEEQAGEAAAAHWGTEKFKDAVRAEMRATCPQVVEKSGAAIDEVLDKPMPRQ